MKQPGDSTFSSDAEMEVELTTQDLVGLTPAYPVDAPSITPIEAATLVTVAAPAAMAAPSTPAASQSNRRRVASRALGIAATVTVSLIAIASLAEFAPPQRIVERPVSNWSPVPDPVAVDEATEEAAPMLFANPFDPSEVFELPPGTTRDQAREMVAEMLLKRAGERQVYTARPRS